MNYFNELKEIKTLLVDDDEFIRDSLSIAFSAKGCLLHTAESAEEGLKALKKEDYDLIISDLRLPGKDGFEFLRSVRKSKPNTLCVLITAYRDSHNISDASALGVDDFIEKPFSVSGLVKCLARLLNGRSHNLAVTGA